MKVFIYVGNCVKWAMDNKKQYTLNNIKGKVCKTFEDSVAPDLGFVTLCKKYS